MKEYFPVSILIGYEPTPGNRWQEGRWRVEGVVAGGQGKDVCQTPLNGAGQSKQFLWTGFSVELFKDDAESYYFNIINDVPRIFVICTPADAGRLEPFMVTLSYDEAASYMESDEVVESVAMPAELYRWVEQFVLEHYVPEKRKKRKRVNWKENTREPLPGR